MSRLTLYTLLLCLLTTAFVLNYLVNGPREDEKIVIDEVQQIQHHRSTDEQLVPDVTLHPQLFISTALGNVSYDEMEQMLYRRYGYRILEYSEPVPRLEFVHPPKCGEVMSSWLAPSKGSDEFGRPRKTIPVGLRDEFLMGGLSLYQEWYHDDRSKPHAREWTKIPAWLKLDESKLGGICIYGSKGLVLLHALQYHSAQLREGHGFVVGSQQPWAEVYALRSGAAKILTVEYQKTTIRGTDAVSYIHPVEFAEKWEQFADYFDFAITFSSIEHSGLGRYGDALDHIGDIREVNKISCMLKTGGLLFVGFPRGRDKVVFNAHRIYGRIRLAMIFAGFEWLTTFQTGSKLPTPARNGDFESTSLSGVQDVYVLKKL